MFAFAAWANDLALGLGLEAKGTGGGPFQSWAGLGVIIAGFEAVLAVTALRVGGALETSGILFLELVREEEDTLAFPLPFFY